ncbi:MAG: S9 family peptidase, partial [Deltaproteobacteria bacterium]|nr:S9 family peptidase [Deltaproteobacteria bacterium]
PDKSDKIFFTANVFTECAADFACTKKKLDAAAEVTSAIVADDLHFRPWNFWRDGTFSNLFAMYAATLEVKAVATGGFDTPPVPFGGRDDIAITPDGEYAAYAVKLSEPAIGTNDDIFEVEVKSGKTKKISKSLGADIAPDYSPDGRYIAFAGQETAGFESDRWRLKIYDRKTGGIKSLTDGFDGWVLSHRWSRDGGRIFFVTEEKGYRPLYSIEVKSGKIRKLLDKVVIKTFSVIDGAKILLTLETMQALPDVYLLDISGGKTKKLTALNEESLKGVEFGALEEHYYDGAKLPDGKRRKIHTFVIKPPQYKKGEKYPLVVMIHGGPQGAWLNSFHSRWNAMVIASNGFFVALPNPTGSTGYGQDFVDAISRDWGGKCYEDIMALLDFTATLDFVDNDRVCAMGGSFGGYMTNWIAGQTDRFKCLISHAGVFNLTSKYGSTDELWFPEWDIGGTPWDNPENFKKFSPHEYVKKVKTPVLFIHGQNDFRVPVEQALQGFTFLKRLGVETRLVYFPDEDHFINKPLNRKFWYDTVSDWLGKYLKKM